MEHVVRTTSGHERCELLRQGAPLILLDTGDIVRTGFIRFSHETFVKFLPKVA